MAFVEVICKNCGGKIILDDKMKSGVCEYCKTTFVRENTNITNHFHNNTTVVYNTDSSIEEKLKSADVHLNQLDNYENAREIYEYVIQNRAGDYRGWWGMVLVLSRKLTYIDCGGNEFAKIREYAENALKVADGEHRKEIAALWNDYSDKVSEYMANAFLEAAEKKREEERIRDLFEQRYRKRQTARKMIGIIPSLVCNIGVLIWYFFTNGIEGLSDTGLTALAIFVGILFVNSVLTAIFCKIGSTGGWAVLPLIVNIITVTTTAFRDMQGSEQSATYIVAIIVWVILGLIITALCSFIPLSVFKNRYLYE